MANGGSSGGIKNFVNETVVQPVRDEFQRAVESGMASVTGKAPQNQIQKTQKTPQDLQKDPQFQQKQLQDQKKVQNIKQFFATMSAQEQQLRQQKNQEQQEKQQKTQEEQEKKQVKQFEVAKKQQILTDLQSKQRRVEIKKGGF